MNSKGPKMVRNQILPHPREAVCILLSVLYPLSLPFCPLYPVPFYYHRLLSSPHLPLIPVALSTYPFLSFTPPSPILSKWQNGWQQFERFAQKTWQNGWGEEDGEEGLEQEQNCIWNMYRECHYMIVMCYLEENPYLPKNRHWRLASEDIKGPPAMGNLGGVMLPQEHCRLRAEIVCKTNGMVSPSFVSRHSTAGYLGSLHPLHGLYLMCISPDIQIEFDITTTSFVIRCTNKWNTKSVTISKVWL